MRGVMPWEQDSDRIAPCYTLAEFSDIKEKNAFHERLYKGNIINERDAEIGHHLLVGYVRMRAASARW